MGGLAHLKIDPLYYPSDASQDVNETGLLFFETMRV
jgi:hypothetical protein